MKRESTVVIGYLNQMNVMEFSGSDVLILQQETEIKVSE